MKEKAKAKKGKKTAKEIIHIPNDAHDVLMSNDEIWKNQVSAYLQIPIDIRLKAFAAIREIIKTEDIEKISKAIKEDPVCWYFSNDLSWGAKVRNFLRKNVCLDEELPAGSWNEAFPIIIAVAILEKTEDEIMKGFE